MFCTEGKKKISKRGSGWGVTPLTSPTANPARRIQLLTLTSWGPLWRPPYVFHVESIGRDGTPPSARAGETSVGAKIGLSCGSGTMKNEFCDPENPPTKLFKVWDVFLPKKHFFKGRCA